MILSQFLKEIEARCVNHTELSPILQNLQINRPSELKSSDAGTVAFFFSKEYQSELLTAKPSVLVTAEPFVEPLKASGLPIWRDAVIVVSSDPYWAMAKSTELFADVLSQHAHTDRSKPSGLVTVEIHPTSIIDPSVKLGKGVHVGAYAVIEAGAELEDGVVIYPQVYIGPKVKIGRGTVLFPGVKVYERTVIGSECRVHAGVILGADGFGYAVKKVNGVPVHHQKIYHFGRVVVGDHVEIGPNTTIDRGTFSDTEIHSGSKIDNLVQVGHNCTVGEGTILCGNSGMAGNSSTGKFVVVGGGSGLSNKVHIGDFAQVGGMTGVPKDVPAGGTSMGMPGRDIKEYFKIQAMLNRLLKEREKK